MGIRDEEVTHKVQPTHLRAPNGRVFIATPHLLARGDMEPIYDGKIAEKEISNKDVINRKGPPSHVRNAAGRVFIATQALIERGDMELLYDYNEAPAKATKKNNDFVLSKATKQEIYNEGIERFDVEISTDLGLKQMRAEFSKLEDIQKESSEDEEEESDDDEKDVDADDSSDVENADTSDNGADQTD